MPRAKGANACLINLKSQDEFIIYNRQKISIAYLSVGYLDKNTNETNTNTNLTDNISNYTYSNSGYHFSDQFNNNNNRWFTVNDDKKEFSVRNGKYYIKHKRNEKGWSTYDQRYLDTNHDFEIEIKIYKISGVNNYGYGLIFGKKENDYFRLFIFSSCYHKLARVIDNKKQVIKKCTTTSHVNAGNLKSNVLKVKKENNYYKFYINGNYVFQTEFEQFYGG